MAKRIFASAGLTFATTTPGVSSANGAYMAIAGATATQTTDVLEILISGKASASTVGAFDFARMATNATTPTALAAPHSDGPMHFATAALTSSVTTFTAAASGPVPSSSVSDTKIQLGINMFGGIIRWNAAPTQQFTMVGTSAPGGTAMLFNNASAGGQSGASDAHIIYETY